MTISEDKLFQLFMKQDQSFSKFYEKFKEEDTGDSTSFLGNTPQTTINPEDIEEEEMEDGEEEVDNPSFDYRNDGNSIKLGRNKG